MKNLSVCLLLFFVAVTAAVAQFRKHDLAAEFEGMKVTLLSRTETFKAYFTVAVKATSISGIDRVTINDETAIAAENDEFYATLKLDYGENSITVTAIAKNGEKNEETFTLHRTRPEINDEHQTEVVTPNDGPTIAITHVDNQAIRPTVRRILVTEEIIRIRGTVTDPSGVKSLEIDGQLVWVKSGGSFEAAISLNNYGMNPITIEAIDNEGNVSEHSFTIYQRPNRDGKDFALFFATDEYTGEKDNNGDWLDLMSSIRDVEAVAKNLRDNYGFETRVFKNLTRRQLLNTLYKYRNDFDGTEYTEGSQILLFFTGHGHYNQEEEEGYLITADTDTPSVDPTMASALSHTKLRKQIDVIACRRILVMLDTDSGGVFDPGYVPLPVLRGIFDNSFTADRIKKMLSLEARWVLTSSGAGEYTANGMTGHTPFTEAFLNALNTKGAEDFLLTLDEVWYEIQKSKDNPIYDIIMKAMKNSGREFRRPEPRKGQFGKSHSAKSNFLFFPLP